MYIQRNVRDCDSCYTGSAATDVSLDFLVLKNPEVSNGRWDYFKKLLNFSVLLVLLLPNKMIHTISTTASRNQRNLAPITPQKVSARKSLVRMSLIVWARMLPN